MTRDIDSTAPDITRAPLPLEPTLRGAESIVRNTPERECFELRGYRYQVSQSELATLREIGAFRTIRVEDLARFRYGGDAREMREQLGSLRAQGLLQRHSTWTGGRAEKTTVVVLTKTGRDLLESHRPPGSTQRFYARLVKPAEVAHDAAIYRMYQAEKETIERSGGRVRRVVLDYELKQKIYRPLAKAKALPSAEYSRQQAEIAGQNGLKVVGGKILLPDLRIEYQTVDGGGAQVDLELATHHYRGSHMRGKAEAGFKMYAPQEAIGRLTAAFDPELTSEIFSF